MISHNHTKAGGWWIITFDDELSRADCLGKTENTAHIAARACVAFCLAKRERLDNSKRGSPCGARGAAVIVTLSHEANGGRGDRRAGGSRQRRGFQTGDVSHCR